MLQMHMGKLKLGVSDCEYGIWNRSVTITLFSIMCRLAQSTRLKMITGFCNPVLLSRPGNFIG